MYLQRIVVCTNKKEGREKQVAVLCTVLVVLASSMGSKLAAK